MITWADYLSQAERRKDEMAQAEQHRLHLQAAKRHSPLLNWFALVIYWSLGVTSYKPGM